MKKILIIGSWAKEQATIENIKKNSFYKVFSYLDVKNPGIISLADRFCLSPLTDNKSILAYAKKINPDLTIVTTAKPLACGIVDKLEARGYRVFGPKRVCAQLESNKAFTRNLMKKHVPESLPDFRVFKKEEKALSYAAGKNFKIAVKPVGLTEGLGVRVFDGRAKDSRQAESYITSVLKSSKEKKVIVEEKIQGQEFTLQCLVNGELILPTPCIRDFKKLLPGDKGPNTASMGSYSDAGRLLPFMSQSDYKRALVIIKRTLSAFYQETGQTPRGFLYGQFMINGKSIKLIEYNFRPGDPEWINTIFVLSNNIADVIDKLLSQKKQKLNFESKATVCKYIVPKKYPYKLNQVLNADFSFSEIKKAKIGIYYSCGTDKKGRFQVGSERGIAFVAKAKTIPAAASKVENIIAKVKGDFFYRKDIGRKSS